MSDETLELKLRVNGKERSAGCEPRTLLSDLLRDDLGCKEVRVGCEHGVCGACTVILDGAAVRSCIMLAGSAEGAEITTIAGLVEDGQELPPLQRALSAEHGFQCGFCTGGIVMSVMAEAQAGRSKEEVLEDALGGHLCRCTGYVNIRRAIESAWPAIERREA